MKGKFLFLRGRYFKIFLFQIYFQDSSTKNTVASSAGNTPPVQRSSLTDLTKAGIAASTSSISAEAIRDRVAKSSSHQDVQVDIHQPKHLSSHHHNPDETDVGPLLDQRNTSSEAANTSATTTNNEVESVSNHRRFSNLSNLAQSLPSTSSSASALVAGSVDFLTSGCHGNQGRHGGRGHLRGRGSRDQRRNQRMMNMGGNDLESTPNQQTGLFFFKKIACIKCFFKLSSKFEKKKMKILCIFTFCYRRC